MININFGQQMQNPAIQICQEHPECKDCPLLHGQQIQMPTGWIRCETSMIEEKKNE